LTKIYKLKIPKNEKFFTIDYCDLYNLYKIVIKRKPSTVVEIGSGFSTWIIAKALEENYKKYQIYPIFYSLEQEEKYKTLIENFLKENLSIEANDFTKIIKTNLSITKFKETNVSVCENFPNIKIDFLYEDRTDIEEFKIAGDAIIAENKMSKNYCICVDGMKQTVNFYKKNLTRDYKIVGGFFHGYTFYPK